MVTVLDSTVQHFLILSWHFYLDVSKLTRSNQNSRFSFLSHPVSPQTKPSLTQLLEPKTKCHLDPFLLLISHIYFICRSWLFYLQNLYWIHPLLSMTPGDPRYHLILPEQLNGLIIGHHWSIVIAVASSRLLHTATRDSIKHFGSSHHPLLIWNF